MLPSNSPIIYVADEGPLTTALIMQTDLSETVGEPPVISMRSPRGGRT